MRNLWTEYATCSSLNANLTSHTPTHPCMHAWMHARMYAHTHTHIHTQINTHKHTYTHKHTHIHTHTHTNTQIYLQRTNPVVGGLMVTPTQPWHHTTQALWVDIGKSSWRRNSILLKVKETTTYRHMHKWTVIPLMVPLKLAPQTKCGYHRWSFRTWA